MEYKGSGCSLRIYRPLHSSYSSFRPLALASRAEPHTHMGVGAPSRAKVREGKASASP